MVNPLDKHLNAIVARLVTQQGLTFSTEAQARQYLINTKNELATCFRQSDALLTEGLQYLQASKQPYVADVCSKLLKFQNSSKKSKAIIGKLAQHEHALRYFTDEVMAYCDAGDDHKELCVIAVLMALFPLNPQAYICLGSYIWRTGGIAAAADFYTKVSEFINDPALLYFAADCFKKSGNVEKAKELIQCSLAKVELSNDIPARLRFLELLEQPLSAM